MKYRIDLHVHSKFSGDNDHDPEEFIIQALKLNLYGIAFTEHYSYKASEPIEILKRKYKDKIKIFRGVEFSSADGHCLVFGVDTDRLQVKHAPAIDLVQIVNRSGGVVIPSHPYRIGTSLGDMIESIKGFCAIEGYNGCNIHAFNDKAVKTARRLNLPFTGGSDAHAPDEVGSCFTEFYDEVRDENFLDILRTGCYLGVDTRKISRGWIF